jgi:hypothetical protein
MIAGKQLTRLPIAAVRSWLVEVKKELIKLLADLARAGVK